ncbi:MAG: bifunctional folylpolyglutamate synthase/dihydrofolate synthase, partial [Gemmatimonadales bacterium]
MPLSYVQALDLLFPRTTTIKFGLETTTALLERLGRPQDQFPVIHVGGTNGKGSTTTLVATALTAAGRRVGHYTSPHLISFRERIRVDGVSISEAAVAAWTEELRPLIEETGATFFEASTAIALADFAARGVDIAVVEVGLGGRLDSTNVVTPVVSGVSKIARDHMKYLGETLEGIAREKAGIAKPGVAFVIGETEPHLVEVLQQEAKARGGVPVVVPAAERWSGSLGLGGTYQRRNAAVARAILTALPASLRPDPEAVATGFAEARLPGRFDRRGKWLFDVAHNPDGMRALVQALHDAPVSRPIHAVVSILGDKEWPEMLVELDRAVDQGWLTVAPSADHRGWTLEWLERWLRDPARPPAQASWHLEPDLHRALA